MTLTNDSNHTRDQQEASLGLLTFSAGSANSQSSSFSKEFMEDQQKFLNVEPQECDDEESPQEQAKPMDENGDDNDDESEHS